MEVIRGGDFVMEAAAGGYLYLGLAWIERNLSRWNSASLFALATISAFAPVCGAVNSYGQESTSVGTGTVLQQLEVLKDRPNSSEPPFVEILDPDPKGLIEVSKPRVDLTYKIRSPLGPVKIALFVDGDRVALDDSQQPHQDRDEHEFVDHVGFEVPEHDAG
jgi:hypothetical protein